MSLVARIGRAAGFRIIIGCAALLFGISHALSEEAYIDQIQIPEVSAEPAVPAEPAVEDPCRLHTCYLGDAGGSFDLPEVGNRASIDQSGDSNTSRISQSGSGNRADVAITGSNNETSHTQTGNGNFARADIVGSGSDVTVSQNGGDQSLITLNGDNYAVKHELTGNAPGRAETSVSGTLSGPIEVSNPSWGRITVESK